MAPKRKAELIPVDKSVEEVVEEVNKKRRFAEADFEEAKASENAQLEQIKEAKDEFEKMKAEVAAATEAEVEAAKKFKELTTQRSDDVKKVTDARTALFEAQKKVALIDILAVNHARIQALEKSKMEAREAAEAAKRSVLEQKRLEKEAMIGLRQALTSARADGRGAGKAKPDAKSGGAEVVDDVVADTAGSTAAADID